MTVEQKSGPFGGLSASEAAKRSAEVRKRNKAERAEGSNPSPQSNAEIERNLRVIAMGHGAPAVQAASLLEKLGVFKPAEHASDQALLALLTPEQRQCIEAHLSDEFVPEDLALRAWRGVDT